MASGTPADIGLTITGQDVGARLLGTPTSGNLSGQQMRFLLNGDPQTGGTINTPALVVPPLGNTGHAVPVLTKTLLFAGEGSNSSASAARTPPGMPVEITPNYGEPWFRAFDKQTGAVLAEVKLPAGTTGAPITYMHRGKQYIVVAVGGRDLDPEWVALSLPEGQ